MKSAIFYVTNKRVFYSRTFLKALQTPLTNLNIHKPWISTDKAGRLSKFSIKLLTACILRRNNLDKASTRK
jgi:hypothetical protein